MQEINPREYFKLNDSDFIEVDHEEFYTIGLCDTLDKIKVLLRDKRVDNKYTYVKLKTLFDIPNFRRIKIASTTHNIYTTLDIITNFSNDKEIIENFVDMQVLKRYCKVSVHEFLDFILDHSDQILDKYSRDLAVIEKLQDIFISQAVPTFEILEDLQWLFTYLNPDIIDKAKAKIKENYIEEFFNIDVIDTTDEIIKNLLKDTEND